MTRELFTVMTDKPLNKKLDELYKLVEGIEIAMMTTLRADGSMVSRPMATQERLPGTDFWFVTDVESDKIAELAQNPVVSLAYFKNWEWVSISGTAIISTDRDMIREVYKPDWKVWFGDEGGARDGGPDDPRFALILVDATSAVYGKRNKSMPVAMFEVVKGMVTGDAPDVADIETLTEPELHRNR